jgi:hypothetical protein
MLQQRGNRRSDGSKEWLAGRTVLGVRCTFPTGEIEGQEESMLVRLELYN